MMTIRSLVDKLQLSVRPVVVLTTLVAVFSSCPAVEAQHAIEVQRKVAEGSYLEALTIFDRMAQRRATTAARAAAGRASWALSLPERAAAEFDKALRDKTLATREQGRLTVSRGIIEYQEQRYQVAVLFAERAVGLLESGPLRSKAWLLWGESLMQLKSYGAAEEKYEQAVSEAAPDEQPEIHFLLGECQLRLNKLGEARGNFEQVPLYHERTPEAIRHLAGIALEEQRYEAADFWLRKGREDYPERFLDSWVDYALVKVAVNTADLEQVRLLQQAAQEKYPPADHWLTLLNAVVETYEWQRSQPVEEATYEKS